ALGVLPPLSAGDRRDEMHLALLADPLEQAESAHVAVDRDLHARAECIAVDQSRAHARIGGLEVRDDLAHRAPLDLDPVLAAGQVAQQRRDEHGRHNEAKSTTGCAPIWRTPTCRLPKTSPTSPPQSSGSAPGWLARREPPPGCPRSRRRASGRPRSAAARRATVGPATTAA